MIATPLNEGTVGTYFIDKSGEVWKHVAYTDKPTATLIKISDPSVRRSGVVYAPIFDEFNRLVIEERPE